MSKSNGLQGGAAAAPAMDAKAQAIIAKGEHILVVGVQKGNLPEGLFSHPQVTCWDGFDLRVSKVPAHGLLVFTRFTSHTAQKRVRSLSKTHCPDAYIYPGVLGTGHIRALLAPLQAEGLNVMPVGRGVPHSFGRGDLQAFVREHIDRDNVTAGYGGMTKEVERLHRMAHAEGRPTSIESMRNTVSNILGAERRAIEEEQAARYPKPVDVPAVLAPVFDAEQAAREAKAAQAARLIVPPATPPVVAAAVVDAQVQEHRLAVGIAEVVRMLDDSLAALQLARETVLTLSTQNTLLQTGRDALKARILKVFEEA